MSERLELLPQDSSDQALRAAVGPPEWTNPTPAERYDLVVIGGGTAGLTTAAGAASAGVRVALVETDLLGGDSLNVGCVPSKALLRCARAAAEARGAGRFGVRAAGVHVDFAETMRHVRGLRARLAPTDSAARFRELGVDVFLGTGRFTGADAITVRSATLRFNRAVVATGARATRPPLPSLTEGIFLTNETVFNLTALPRRLAILGAGPIGCELAQAFARLGAQVTLLSKAAGVLPREDPDASAVVAAALRRDGVRLESGRELGRITEHRGERALIFKDGTSLPYDELLVCIGRSPNVHGLGLDKAGVTYDAGGVKVNDRLRTSNPRVYAAGDVCSRFKYTHAADAMARVVLQNALAGGRARVSALTIPWCTYTDPELAHVGLTPAEAAERGIAIDTFAQEMKHVDRAVLDGAEEGFLKVHVRKGTDRIVGATAVAATAGAMISEITLAMTAGVGLKTLARTVHPYPTQGEAVKKVADAYYRGRMRPASRGLLSRLLMWWR